MTRMITKIITDLYVPGNDRLTYELSGRDEKSFRINGPKWTTTA